MIVRIGKCEIPKEEVASMTHSELSKTFEVCRMTPKELLLKPVKNTEWYGRTNDFNYFTNNEMTRNLCGDNVFCMWDSINRSIMESTKFTHETYNFITWYIAQIKDGVNNEIAKIEGTLNFIFSALTMWNIE